MFDWFSALSSAIRWGIFALLITALLLLFEGSGMLSKLTEGHPAIRKAMAISFWILLAFTVFLVVVWMVNPTVDNTPSQLSEIRETLNEMKDILKAIQQDLQSLR